jgi:purine nucleoside permease
VKYSIKLALAIAIALLAIESAPTKALPSQNLYSQRNVTIIRTNSAALNRAKNLARQAAVEANGGLSQYRPEDAMHGPADQAPYVDNGDGTWTFTIRGRRPNSQAFTMETVVTVSQDGKEVTVDYNGLIRDR